MSRVVEAIITWVRSLGATGSFSFPDSRDFLEVIGGPPWQRERPIGRIREPPRAPREHFPPRVTPPPLRESSREVEKLEFRLIMRGTHRFFSSTRKRAILKGKDYPAMSLPTLRVPTQTLHDKFPARSQVSPSLQEIVCLSEDRLPSYVSPSMSTTHRASPMRPK